MTSEENEAIKLILRSPTLFSDKVLGIHATRYQADLLECEKNSIVLWARQSGKTTTLATKALHRALTRKNQEILIIAPVQRQAALMFAKIKDICEINEFVKGHTRRVTLNDVEFDSGSRIHCLSAGHEGASIRGYSASMIIFDEAALIPDPVFSAVRPSMAVRGEQLILSGTPYGKRGYFYSQFHNNEMKAPTARTWEVFRVKAEQNPFIDKSEIEDAREALTADMFIQEYEAEFIADNDSFYPYSLVATVMDDYHYSLPRGPPRGGKLIMGVDIARAGSDETAFVICSVSADESYKVEWTQTYSKNTIPETAGRVVELAHTFPDMEIYMDESGVGGGAVDLVKERNVGVRGVTLSTDVRNRMYSGLKLAMEQHRVVFSREDVKMRNQFAGYSGKTSSDGKWHIVKGGAHDDCVDALALCFTGEGDVEFVPFGEGMELNVLRRQQIAGKAEVTWKTL